jgi:hypothetical protein
MRENVMARDAYKSLVEERVSVYRLGRQRREWEDNIKTNLSYVMKMGGECKRLSIVSSGGLW